MKDRVRIDPRTSFRLSQKVSVRAGWVNPGRCGLVLGRTVEIDGVRWVPVLWRDADDPDWHKVRGLEKGWPS